MPSLNISYRLDLKPEEETGHRDAVSLSEMDTHDMLMYMRGGLYVELQYITAVSPLFWEKDVIGKFYSQASAEPADTVC